MPATYLRCSPGRDGILVRRLAPKYRSMPCVTCGGRIPVGVVETAFKRGEGAREPWRFAHTGECALEARRSNLV